MIPDTFKHVILYIRWPSEWSWGVHGGPVQVDWELGDHSTPLIFWGLDTSGRVPESDTHTQQLARKRHKSRTH